MSSPPPPGPGEEEEKEEDRRQGRSVKTEEEDDPLITLKVLDLEGRRAFHAMRMSHKLQGVMDAYYKKAAADVPYGSGTFIFDGSIRLRDTNTPAELDLNDGDEIDFYATQVGGGR